MTSSDPFLNFKFHRRSRDRRPFWLIISTVLVLVFLAWLQLSERFFLIFAELVIGILLWLGLFGWRNRVSRLIDFLEALIR